LVPYGRVGSFSKVGRNKKQTQMGNEIELKFAVAPSELQKFESVRGAGRKSPKEEDLISIYFDTPKHKLARNGVSLRVRHNGGKFLQTIKSVGSNGTFKRGEWEHKIKGDVPDVRKTHGTPLAPLLTKKFKRRLKPIFETRIRRITVPVRRNGSHIEMARWTRGEVRAGRKSDPISELELELKRGRAGDMFKLAREMGNLAPATLSFKTKSERGYDLIENRPAQAVRAEKIRVRRGMSPTDAFRTIARSILRDIAANEAAVRKSDSKGVHQMRVGLRRLRATISLFSNLIDDQETERVKAELKWLTGELAPARDLDVYVRNEIEPLRGARLARRGMKELAGTLTSRRDVAFGKARTAVESRRYRSLLLDTLQWLETGTWPKQARHHKQRPIERFAADIFARRTKAIMKKTKKIRELDSPQRHKLRIAVKKLRYASDFFEHLFGGRTAKKRLPDFRARLTDLQDRLGALNDIKVHQKLAIAAGRPGVKADRTQAFAIGVVSRREQSEIEPLLKAADKDARKFSHLRPFWV
jgi:inorganic triphosphatase YgiF